MSDNIDEALSMAQRKAVGRRMRRLAPRIKIARERALKRTATPEKVKQRAKKQARNKMFKKLTNGKTKSEVSFARRQEVEKRLSKLDSRIERMALKLIPKVRKQDRDRHNKKSDK